MPLNKDPLPLTNLPKNKKITPHTGSGLRLVWEAYDRGHPSWRGIIKIFQDSQTDFLERSKKRGETMEVFS
jgi:hypothetical protein